jgi:hypothetical protein
VECCDIDPNREAIDQIFRTIPRRCSLGERKWKKMGKHREAAGGFQVFAANWRH